MDGRSLRVFVYSRPSVKGKREGEGGSDRRPPACNYDGYRAKLSTSFCLISYGLGDRSGEMQKTAENAWMR